MSIFDFFTREAGQERRRALEGLLTQFIPPEMRPQLGLLAEANPVTSMERAGQDAQQLFAPDQTIMDRIASLGRMSSNIAGTVAPAVVAGRAGVPVANAVQDVLTGYAPAVQPFLVDDFGGVGLPRAADAAAERGAQIMNMLRSGRSADVTDAMLDMGDPVLNARLNEYLYRNYDLPMDAASRAARAEGMGLSQQTYHGTPYADITAMRPSEFGAVGPGVYAAGRPVTASDYSRGYGMMTPKETFEVAGERYTPGGNVMPIQTPQNLQSFEDWTAAKMADMQRQGLYSSGFRADAAASQAAADAGFGGVSARNENVVIFDPANVRSRFARFDPRLSHLKNLNAAIAAGVPLGLLAMQPREEQY